jgi:hypothetical protein
VWEEARNANLILTEKLLGKWPLNKAEKYVGGEHYVECKGTWSCGWEVNDPGSGSCPLAGLCITGVEPSGSTTRELVMIGMEGRGHGLLESTILVGDLGVLYSR